MAPPTTTTIAWRVRFLGLSFFLLFFAYSSAQTLESTLNGAAGFLCLSLIYAFLAVSFLCAPYIVSLVGERRLPALFFCAALFYVAFVSSKLLRSGPASAVLGLLSCAGVGLGGGPLWAAQGFYIARATAAYHAVAPLDSGATVSSISTLLNSSFYTIWMFSGAASNAISSLVMQSFTDPARSVAALFALLTVVGCCGLLALTMLPTPGEAGLGVCSLPFCLRRAGSADAAALMPAAAAAEAGEAAAGPDAAPPAPHPAAPRRRSFIPWPEPSDDPAPAAPPGDATVPSPWFMVKFILSSREVAFVAPLSFATGAGQGFVCGAWMAAVVGDTAGPQYVGIVGAAYSVSSAVGAVVWGRLAQRASFGRRTAFALAHGVLAWFLGNACVWWAGGLEARAEALQAARRGAAAAAAPPPPLPPLPLSHPALVAALVVVQALFSMVDPVMQAFTSATMQVYYPVKPQLACAVAAPRFFYAIGFALQQFLALGLSSALGRPCIGEQCLGHACMVLVSGASLWWLHTRVRPIDPLPVPEGALEGKDGAAARKA